MSPAEQMVVTKNDVGTLPAGEIIRTEDAALLVNWDQVGAPVRYRTSLKPDNPEDAHLIYAALNMADKRVGACIGEVIHLRSFLIHPTSTTDKDSGELVQLLRVVLITAAGETLECCSEGILGSIQALCSLKGQGPWEPPLTVKIRQIDTKDAKRIFKLDWIKEPSPAKGGQSREQK